ncbi:MAG: diacylglycerol kinase [Ignavibacteriaceae bacterium]|nr:diacylglycerol kinase [Ignavibacteriaceae bacterium]
MVVLVNKYSGGGTALEKWTSIYKQLGLNGSTESFFIGVNGSTDKLILDSIKKGKTDFVIAGGDGSINYFLNRCIQLLKQDELKQIKMGAVGIGSSNDFHKPFNSNNTNGNVSYKINFKDAVKRDVGCIQYQIEGKIFKKYFYQSEGKILKKFFLINASLGITAEGNNSFNNPDSILRYLKKLNTQSAITYAIIKNIFTYKNFKVTIGGSNESFTANISNLGILKSPFFTGKLRYQSDPLPDNGLFDVHFYESLSKVKLLKLFYNLSKGKSDASLNKKFWRTDRLKISSDKEFAVEFDGEVITTKYAEFSVIPELIKVCTN